MFTDEERERARTLLAVELDEAEDALRTNGERTTDLQCYCCGSYMILRTGVSPLMETFTTGYRVTRNELVCPLCNWVLRGEWK